MFELKANFAWTFYLSINAIKYWFWTRLGFKQQCWYVYLVLIKLIKGKKRTWSDQFVKGLTELIHTPTTVYITLRNEARQYSRNAWHRGDTGRIARVYGLCLWRVPVLVFIPKRKYTTNVSGVVSALAELSFTIEEVHQRTEIQFVHKFALGCTIYTKVFRRENVLYIEMWNLRIVSRFSLVPGHLLKGYSPFDSFPHGQDCGFRAVCQSTEALRRLSWYCWSTCKS